MAEQQAMREMAKRTWAAGDYPTLSKVLTPMAAKVVRVAGVRPGERVLDVACGTGPAAITARRAGAEVTALDITPELLARGRQEAAGSDADGIVWREGDAEELPFGDGTFDVVLSTVGHMFAPRPDVAAREMLRVTKRGGRIVFATWPPDACVGATVGAIRKHAGGPPGPSPLEWGLPNVILQRFPESQETVFIRDAVYSNVLSPNAYWDQMSEKFGPLVMALRALQDPAKVEALRKDFLRGTEPWFQDNQVRLDYLVTRIVKP